MQSAERVCSVACASLASRVRRPFCSSLISGEGIGFSSTPMALLLPQNPQRLPVTLPLHSAAQTIPGSGGGGGGRSGGGGGGAASARGPNNYHRERSTSAPNVCIVNPNDTSSLEVTSGAPWCCGVTTELTHAPRPASLPVSVCMSS